MSIWRELLGLPVKPAAGRGLQRRGYHAANTGRLFADFLASSKSADSELRTDLVVMRNRSRALARDDVYVRRYLALLQTNVIGDTGMAMQVKARNTNSSLDVIGNKTIENAWAVFGLVGNCTADGRASWIDLQNQVILHLARDGEAFVQVVRSRAFKHGIAFHLIEADQVDEQKNQRLRDGNEIRMGVEVDGNHRPVAYHVKTRHPGDYEFSSINDNPTVRVPASDMIHVFKQERAGQTRGEPWMAAAITQLKMLNAHREAELVASRMAASKMGFFTSETGDEAPADDFDNGVPIIEAEPGTFHQLPAGVDFKEFNPSHPATAFAEFQKGILRGTASGLGVSYAALTSDLSETSYSSIRQGALEERDAYKMIQKFILEHFVSRAYAEWMQHVMEFGVIGIPAPRFEKFFMATTFRPRGWQWVDPQKEISAAGEAMHLGIMSPRDVSNQYGRDYEETLDQWQQDKEIAESRGMELAFLPFGGNQQNKGQPEVDEPVQQGVAPAPVVADKEEGRTTQIIFGRSVDAGV